MSSTADDAWLDVLFDDESSTTTPPSDSGDKSSLRSTDVSSPKPGKTAIKRKRDASDDGREDKRHKARATSPSVHEGGDRDAGKTTDGGYDKAAELADHRSPVLGSNDLNASNDTTEKTPSKSNNFSCPESEVKGIKQKLDASDDDRKDTGRKPRILSPSLGDNETGETKNHGDKKATDQSDPDLFLGGSDRESLDPFFSNDSRDKNPDTSKDVSSPELERTGIKPNYGEIADRDAGKITDGQDKKIEVSNPTPTRAPREGNPEIEGSGNQSPVKGKESLVRGNDEPFPNADTPDSANQDEDSESSDEDADETIKEHTRSPRENLPNQGEDSESSDEDAEEENKAAHKSTRDDLPNQGEVSESSDEDAEEENKGDPRSTRDEIPIQDEESEISDEDDDEKIKSRRNVRNRFLDLEAGVDEDESEEEEDEDDEFKKPHPDDEAKLRLGQKIDDKGHRELHRRREKNLQLDAEQQAQIFNERYRIRNRTQTDKPRKTSKHFLLPTTKDPAIWAVSCRPRKEKKVIMSITKRIDEWTKMNAPKLVFSAFERGSTQLKSFVYVEARNLADIIEALHGINDIYPRSDPKPFIIPIKERTDLFRMNTLTNPKDFPAKGIRARGSYHSGEMVEVHKGDHRGLCGKVSSVQNEILVLNITEGELQGNNVEVPFKEVGRLIRDGDQVKVIGGSRHCGEVGIVLSIKGDSVIVLSDSRKEFTVLREDLMVSQDADILGKSEKYQIHDLVRLNATTVGCVIKVDRERIEVLDQHSSERSVMFTQISQKIEKHQHATAIDRQGLVIMRGDMVREGGGEQKHGAILHIHHSYIFIRNHQQTTTSGISVLRPNNVVIVSQDGRAANERWTNPANASMGPPPPQKFNYNRFCGQSVSIRRGPNKGLRGILRSATDTHASVELHTKDRHVQVPFDFIIFIDVNGKFENPACHGRFNQGQEASSNEHSAQAKVPRTPAWQLDSNSATSSSRTPAPDGSRTVNLYADGSQTSYGGQTPAWNPGSRTPYYMSSIGGSRSPAWDPSASIAQDVRTSCPRTRGTNASVGQASSLRAPTQSSFRAPTAGSSSGTTTTKSKVPPASSNARAPPSPMGSSTTSSTNGHGSQQSSAPRFRGTNAAHGGGSRTPAASASTPARIPAWERAGAMEAPQNVDRTPSQNNKLLPRHCRQ